MYVVQIVGNCELCGKYVLESDELVRRSSTNAVWHLSCVMSQVPRIKEASHAVS